LTVLGVTIEGKRETESWIKSKGVKYAYAYDKGGKLSGKLGINGIPHAFLIDPSGQIVGEGHPGELTESSIEGALKGALPKPLFDFPPSATPVKNALVKHKYAAALAEADKLSEADGGPELKKVIEGMVSARVASMQAALKEGDFLGAEELASVLKKELDGLPQEPDAEKVLADIKGNKDAARVIAGQKKVHALEAKKMTRKQDIEKAMDDLDKIAKDYAGTFAAKQATEYRTELIKHKNAK
jgi:hypothetical protein